MLKAISNSSVLIALSAIEQLDLLEKRFPEGISIPEAVWQEVVWGSNSRSELAKSKIQNPKSKIPYARHTSFNRTRMLAIAATANVYATPRNTPSSGVAVMRSIDSCQRAKASTGQTRLAKPT